MPKQSVSYATAASCSRLVKARLTCCPCTSTVARGTTGWGVNLLSREHLNITESFVLLSQVDITMTGSIKLQLAMMIAYGLQGVLEEQ